VAGSKGGRAVFQIPKLPAPDGSALLQRAQARIAGAGGALMVTIGVLLITGVWVRLLAPLLRLVNRFTPPI